MRRKTFDLGDVVALKSLSYDANKGSLAVVVSLNEGPDGTLIGVTWLRALGGMHYQPHGNYPSNDFKHLRRVSIFAQREIQDAARRALAVRLCLLMSVVKNLKKAMQEIA